MREGITIPDFGWVRNPIFSPTSCVTCMTHKDTEGFVDLLVDTPVGGRLYMCATCVVRAGRELKMLSREQAADLTKRLTDAHARILELEESLEFEKGNKVLSFKDVKKLLVREFAAGQEAS